LRAAAGSGDPRRAQFAVQADKALTPILRQGDYPLKPNELKLLHCEDFRDDAQHAFHLKNLVRQLREPVAPLDKLIASAGCSSTMESEGQRPKEDSRRRTP
jgi:hypothetical protein